MKELQLSLVPGMCSVLAGLIRGTKQEALSVESVALSGERQNLGKAGGVRRDDGNVPFGKNFREMLQTPPQKKMPHYQKIGFTQISRMIGEKAKNQGMKRK
jgi:hypothetical protein